MAAFGTGAGRPLSGRGGSPGFRFTLFALLSVVLMYLDQRGHYLERVRFVLQTAAYPIQLAVNSPPAACPQNPAAIEGQGADSATPRFSHHGPGQP